MIALIGGKGSIGRRYQAVLNYLDQPFRIIDLGDPKENLKGCTKAIIASTTSTHEDWCWEAFYQEIPFLCEKPLSKSKSAIQSMMSRGVTGYVVNNWQFVATNFDNKMPSRLFYDFYNTGKDGLLWDVCQLILLSDLAECELQVMTDSYFWHAEWGEKTIPYEAIEQSYMQMVRAFLNGETHRLWGLNKAYRMTELCGDLEHLIGGTCENFNWHPGEKWIRTFPQKDFREDWTEDASRVGVSCL